LDQKLAVAEFYDGLLLPHYCLLLLSLVTLRFCSRFSICFTEPTKQK